MKRKYKMTGCAKFFIFLLFALPAAYFVSAYYHGEDGIALAKEKLGLDKVLNKNEDSAKASSNTDTYDLEKVIEELQERMSLLEKELEEKDREIQGLKDQLTAINED